MIEKILNFYIHIKNFILFVIHLHNINWTIVVCSISNFEDNYKVRLLGVDSVWGDCMMHVQSGRLGVIVVELCHFGPFEDFSL